jgi:hypothetical protein
MGFLHYDPTPMTIDEAREYLVVGDDHAQMFGIKREVYFDYLMGRVMKVDLAEDILDESLYDRDNGEGAAKKAIDSIR